MEEEIGFNLGEDGEREDLGEEVAVLGRRGERRGDEERRAVLTDRVGYKQGWKRRTVRWLVLC